MAVSNDKAQPPGLATASDRLAELAAGAGQQLAAQQTDSDAQTASVPLIFLRVGRRWFAVHAECVREVGTKGFVTRVPTAPAHVLGVTLVRGRLVPVLALEGLVGDLGPGETAQTWPRLLVLRHQDMEIALVADETRGVIERRVNRASEAQQSAAWMSTDRPAFLGAEFEWEGKLCCMLDVPALIAAATPGGTIAA